jgi:hypothetical protein
VSKRRMEEEAGSTVTCAPAFCALFVWRSSSTKTEGPADSSGATGLLTKTRAVRSEASWMTRAQTSTSEWERYRTTDPGLPEPEDLFRGCVTLRGDSIRWTRSASEVDTLRMRAVSRRLGNSVLIVIRCFMLF